MSQNTIPLQIMLGARAFGNAYPVRATCGRAERNSELALPPALQHIAERLYLGGAHALGDAAALGLALGRALFTPPLRDMLLSCARQAARTESRLQIQLQIGPSELAALPWEWLAIGGERAWAPSLRDEYTLARVSRTLPPTVPLSVRGPLHVLAVAAPGETLQLAALEAALAEPVRAGKIALHLIDDATPATLERALARQPIHVLHCAAPVARTERGAPRLLLRRGVDLFDMAGLLADATRLRLVTLAGPQGDGMSLNAGLPTLAAALLAPQLPAAIAFGGALPARIAAHFAARCYAALAVGKPADLAVTAGRRALAELGDGRSWGLVQLRMAPGNAELFRILPKARLARRVWHGAALGGASLVAAGALALSMPSLVGEVRALVQDAARTPAATSPTPALLAVNNAPTLPTITPLPPTPEPTAPPPTPASVPAPASYTTVLAQAGDTLDAIARRMGSDASAIALLNHLAPGEALRPDRPLVIPAYQAAEPGAGGLVIRRGNPAVRNVALTFDIEIDAQTLYDILAILRARGLHGTFFVTGHWVTAFPDAARAIVNEGHEIGNHSLTHPFFSRIGLNGAENELAQTEQIVETTIGVTARPYFRFPYGDFTQDTVNLTAHDGYVAYHWSADDPAIDGWLDWAGQHPDEANGGILLMHGRPSTVANLPGWLDRLAGIGLHPTTLTETLR